MTATIRYMGSKRSLAPSIGGLLSRLHPTARVADAFTGTCAVGTTLAPRHAIVANDAHAYAEVVARALLRLSAPDPRRKVARDELMPGYFENRAQLLTVLGDRVRAERRALGAAEKSGQSATKPDARHMRAVRGTSRRRGFAANRSPGGCHLADRDRSRRSACL
jgi:hypothetical protein